MDGTDTQADVRDALATHRQDLAAALEELREQEDVLARMADALIESLRAGGKVLLAGNGGSAAEAQHFSAELVGRYMKDRPPYAALSLTTDTSILTAIGNDYSYDDVFSRQVLGLGRAGDIFIAFSTSGESENLIRAAEAARATGMSVFAMTGARANRLASSADLAIRVPSPSTPIVQEIHTTITHLLCDLIERALTADA